MALSTEDLYDSAGTLSGDVEDNFPDWDGPSGSCWTGTRNCFRRSSPRPTWDAGRRITWWR